MSEFETNKDKYLIGLGRNKTTLIWLSNDSLSQSIAPGELDTNH